MGAAGMVSEAGLVQSCSLAGITAMKGKVTDLRKLDRMIEHNIVEADTADSWADVSRAALMAVRTIKAVCDGTIAVLGEITGPMGKAIGAGYSGATPLAENGGRRWAGQAVKAGDWAKAGAAGAVGAVKVLAPKGAYNDLIEIKKIHTDLVVDAMNSDIDKVAKDLAVYTVKLGEMSLKVAGRKVAGQILNAGRKLVFAGQDIYKAYKEFKDNDMGATFAAARRMLVQKQSEVRQLIAILDRSIATCELEVAHQELEAQRMQSLPRIGAAFPAPRLSGAVR